MLPLPVPQQLLVLDDHRWRAAIAALGGLVLSVVGVTALWRGIFAVVAVAAGLSLGSGLGSGLWCGLCLGYGGRGGDDAGRGEEECGECKLHYDD